MKPHPLHRLPAPLEAAVQTVKLAAREAVERTVESLGLAALSASSPMQRDELLVAQFELNRKSAVFVLGFNEAFDLRMNRELGARADEPEPAKPTGWAALSLVEDHEVELEIAADRFALEVSTQCEWELRELDTYVATLLGRTAAEEGRNPLRPGLVGHALMRAVEAVDERPEVRKTLSAEVGRSLVGILRTTYAGIVADLRRSGVTPASLAVRQRASQDVGSAATDFDTLGRPLAGPDSRGARSGMGSGYESHHGTRGSAAGPLGPGSSRSGWATGAGGIGRGTGTPLGNVDPALMTLMRQLAYVDAGLSHGDGFSGLGTGGPLPNVIRAHRDELRRASSGALDHMVIDVIGTLFDQILSDPKVPPQMARQIARLQVPVLRTALGDPSFFASRKHPVRRFVNRIASLGAAFDTFGEEGAKSVVAKVRELVQEVVEGDFDQIEVYENKLRALEAFTEELARQELAAQNAQAAELLAAKEDELRLRALYVQRLEGDLRTVSAPEFVRDFITKIWSQVLLRAAEQKGADSELVARLRRAGSELFLSVQPKPTPAHRKVFLAELPKLMQDLTDGMNLIGWPDSERRTFFGRLMPAHAEALKNTATRQLDFNLMARQVQGALDKAFPSPEDVKLAGGILPVLTEEIVPARFTAEEAARVGLVDEASVDWKAQVAVDPVRQAEDAELAVAAAVPAGATPGGGRSAIDALPVLTDGAEPTQGRALADAVQIGFAYQMYLEGQWHKVRLSHVSPSRNFFVFTHGQRHKRTVSLTHRMLVRMCDTGRLRSFESAYLLERATARARRQLSAVGGTARG